MRYPKKPETNNVADGEEMEKSQKIGIDSKIEDIWTSSQRYFLKEMKEMEQENKTNLRNHLAKVGIVNGIANTTDMKSGSCIGYSAFSNRTQYSTWFRDHIERFTSGYTGRVPLTFFLQDGRKTRTFLLDQVQLDIIFSHLTKNNYYIESTHSKF